MDEKATSKLITTIPVLMYHQVVKNNPTGSYEISSIQLEADFRSIKSSFVTLFPDEITGFVSEYQEGDKPAIVLSFDDGYKNMYDIVLPLLEKYQLKAVFYLIGSAIGADNYLTIDQIKQMKNSPFCEFGSHTYDLHQKEQKKTLFPRPFESKEKYRKRIIRDNDQMTKLSNDLGLSLKTISLPYGLHNKSTISILNSIGYAIILTVDPHNNYFYDDEEKNKQQLSHLGRFNRDSKYHDLYSLLKNPDSQDCYWCNRGNFFQRVKRKIAKVLRIKK